MPNYELLAISMSIFGGANAVLTRLGLASANVATAVLVTLSVNLIVLGTLLLTVVPVRPYLVPALLLFVVSGLLQPGLVRTISFISFQRIGVARTIPIRSSRPIFAVALAIIFLGETPTYSTLLGTLLIIVGVIFISFEPIDKSAPWRKRDLALPIASAIISAIGITIRKTGLMSVPVPVLAAFVTVLTSWTTTSGATLLLRGRNSYRCDARGIMFLCFAAFASSSGQILGYYALMGGALSTVAPLYGTTPLWTILFTALFLRKIEQVTRYIVLGCFSVVAGIVMIVL